MKCVRFIRAHLMYQPGETAGFDDAVADALIAQGRAIDLAAVEAADAAAAEAAAEAAAKDAADKAAAEAAAKDAADKAAAEAAAKAPRGKDGKAGEA
jgi:hypothetical protein